MSDDRKDLPPSTAPNFLERVREVLSVYLGNRGDVLNRGVTLRDMVGTGTFELNGAFGRGSATPLVALTTAGGSSGSSSAIAIDLTPPPMPTGFVATAGMTNIFIEHAAPTYTQGHGHSHTEVWGSTLALPTFSDAVKVTEFTGTVFAFPSNLATAWHLWIKWVSVDGKASTTPAGGTNGVSATTGKIGNADLNPLIIEAGNLAAGAVDATKFASTIEPVTLVVSGPLPTVKSTNTIYFVPDGKLYSWKGTAYTSTVPSTDVTGMLTDAQIAAIAAAKITGQITTTQITDDAVTTAKIYAGSITTAKIAANAVTAGEIAAGAITTTKLAAGAVTANEIAANTITTAKIAANAITAGEIATGAITAGKMAANAIAVGSAAIENGAIVNAMIANATIDSAKIASLSVSKLTAGSLAVGQYMQSTSYVAGTSGWTLNADGSAELANVTVRGAVYASSGSFTGAVYASSGSFTGAVYASSGTFTGTLNAVTMNSGSINLQGDGGTGWGKLCSYGKWWNDGTNGWVLAREGSTGDTFIDVKAGSNRIWMSSWGDCGIIFPGISMAAGGLTISQVNVIDTLQLAGNSVTIPVGGPGSGSIPSASITLAQAGKIMVMVSVNALAYDGSTSSLYVTATCGGYSGATLGISLGSGDSGALTATGYFSMPAGGPYTVSGTATAANRTIGDTSLFAIGCMR